MFQVMTSVIVHSIFGYSRSCLASLAQTSGPKRALMMLGIMGHAGLIMGTITSYVCITVVELFTDAPLCEREN